MDRTQRGKWRGRDCERDIQRRLRWEMGRRRARETTGTNEGIDKKMKEREREKRNKTRKRNDT